MLLLKIHFAYWLRIEFSENIHRLHKSMTGRSTGLGHGRLAIYFSYDNNSSRNYIKTHLCFNQLMFYGLKVFFQKHYQVTTNLEKS